MRSRFTFERNGRSTVKRTRHLSSRLALERLERRDVPSFVTASTYPTGTLGRYVQDVVAADFDANGSSDVAHVGALGYLKVYLNGGDDGLIAMPELAVAGYDARGVTAGDFNGDGVADIATASYGFNSSIGRIAVFINRGDGTFFPFEEYNAGNTLTSIASADVTGDGKLDLVVTNGVNGAVSILNGTGTGKFRRARTYAAGIKPQSVGVRDLNSDAIPDLVLISPTADTVSVLLGTGGGLFQTATSYPAGDNPLSVATGDFNEDGDMDLVVAGGPSGSGHVDVLFGNGDGTFATPAPYTVGRRPQDVLAEDLDGDGDVDVAIADYDFGGGAVHVMSGNGDGSFAAVESYLAMAWTTAVTTADFNADGLSDLASTASARLIVLPGVGAGVFAGPHAAPATLPVHALAAADFNGDGAIDLAVAESCQNGGCNPSVEILLGTGDGSFTPGQSYAISTGPRDIVVGDFDSDGNPDIAVINSGGLVNVLLGNGDGTFQAAMMYSGGGIGIDTGDFNADGKLDLVNATTAGVGAVLVLFGNGDGTFEAPVSYAAGSSHNSVAAADFNGDGVDDIAATDSDNDTVTVLLANGDGTFQAAVNYAAGGDGVRCVATGDFNGDGAADLVDTHATSGNRVGVLLGNGDGTFEPVVNYATGAMPLYDCLVADFNGDGSTDVVATGHGNNEVGYVALLLGNGDGSLQPAQIYFAGDGVEFAAAGDFTGDGFTDVAVTADDSFAGNLGILFNAADRGPAPIDGGPRMDALATIASDQASTTMTPTLNEVKVERIDHPQAEQPANTKPDTKAIGRIMRAPAKHSDRLTDDIHYEPELQT